MKKENSENTQINQKKRRGAPEKYLWKKGQSGNPAGKPKGSYSLVSLLKKQLEDIPAGHKKTYGQIIIDRIFNKAISEGNEQIIKLIINYIDGLPVQRTENTNTNFNFNDMDDKELEKKIREYGKQ